MDYYRTVHTVSAVTAFNHRTYVCIIKVVSFFIDLDPSSTDMNGEHIHRYRHWGTLTTLSNSENFVDPHTGAHTQTVERVHRLK